MRPKKRASSNIVLVFQSMRLKSGRDMLAGVYTFARTNDWQVQVFDALPDSRKLKGLLDTWNPKGCLVAAALLGKRYPPFGDIPVVYLGRMPGDVFKVEHDSAATSRLAAEELARARPASWAFFGPVDDVDWSRIRRDSFTEDVVRRGGTVDVFDWTGLTPDTLAARTAIGRWLDALPHPAAVFIAADHLAGPLFAAARRAKLRIPEDVAFVGVDNDELICENLKPALTSVLPDFEESGRLLGELLAHRLDDPELAPCTLTYGPREIVRRASTRKSHDSYRVDRALEFIRRRTADGIGVNDVAAEIGCNRRRLERLFAEKTGGTVLAAIQDARLERIFSLLREKNRTLSGIAVRCGCSSETYLKTFFRRRTGLTMREWRAANVR